MTEQKFISSHGSEIAMADDSILSLTILIIWIVNKIVPWTSRNRVTFTFSSLKFSFDRLCLYTNYIYKQLFQCNAYTCMYTWGSQRQWLWRLKNTLLTSAASTFLAKMLLDSQVVVSSEKVPCGPYYVDLASRPACYFVLVARTAKIPARGSQVRSPNHLLLPVPTSLTTV